ncbi:carbohydrate ABC transporter permease [Nocardia cerradoensis]|uniref:carbohydrate ABC transporter permease n=1 Tax=Nocardia cerradoensis TaxID=85688 RepID=UPI0006879D2B|nr:sugar ABC transporter permease [Nocardia cerradoensis]
MTTLGKPRRSALRRRKAAAGRMFIAPNLIAVAVFMAFPLVFTLYLSLHRWDLFSSPTFVGFDNFRRLFAHDPLFWVALRNTVIFTAGTLIPTIVIGLVVAAALNRKLKGIGIFRSIMFMPLVASTVAMAVVWRLTFSTDYGVLNTALGWIGIGPVPWLTDPRWSMFSLCLVSVWKSVPFATIVLLAAIQGIPTDVYEAARIDGAGALRRFRSITVPLIRPALVFSFVITFINSFQVFDQAYVLTGGKGGPETGTYVLGIMLYQNAFSFDDIGYACALAWVIFAILLVLTLLQLRITRGNAYESEA